MPLMLMRGKSNTAEQEKIDVIMHTDQIFQHINLWETSKVCSNAKSPVIDRVGNSSNTS